MDWFRRFSLGETKRTVYFWGMVLAAPSFLLIVLLQPADPYIRYAYPMMMGLCVLWAAMLWYQWSIETIERSAILGVGLLFGG